MRSAAWLLVIVGCGRVDFDARSAVELDVIASVAACIDPKRPDPAACVQYNGAGQLVVDAKDDTTGDPWNSYLRFELPAEFADFAVSGRRVRGATLRLVATDDADAPGPSTGTVWRVAPFTLADLSSAVPATLDPAPLAGSQGMVDKGTVVDWTLPATIVQPGAPICLGVLPDDANGVNYWNLDGPAPPQLRLELE